MSAAFDERNISLKMDKSIQSFKKDISTLRTGRANINMLDIIKVDVYGQLMPIDQLATVSVPEARLISNEIAGVIFKFDKLIFIKMEVNMMVKIK